MFAPAAAIAPGLRALPCRHLRSTLVPERVLKAKWWPGTESNRRRQPFQGCALPTELPGRDLVCCTHARLRWDSMKACCVRNALIITNRFSPFSMHDSEGPQLTPAPKRCFPPATAHHDTTPRSGAALPESPPGSCSQGLSLPGRSLRANSAHRPCVRLHNVAVW